MEKRNNYILILLNFNFYFHFIILSFSTIWRMHNRAQLVVKQSVKRVWINLFDAVEILFHGDTQPGKRKRVSGTRYQRNWPSASRNRSRAQSLISLKRKSFPFPFITVILPAPIYPLPPPPPPFLHEQFYLPTSVQDWEIIVNLLKMEISILF